jgi:hypothetical protein
MPRQRCRVVRRLPWLWVVGCVILWNSRCLSLVTAADGPADDLADNNNNNDPLSILRAHTYVNSAHPEQSRRSTSLPQTISEKKAYHLLDRTPIRYYAGTAKYRMHVTTSSSSSSSSDDADDYYVFYAWRGPSLKQDGHVLQVFQVAADATPHAVAHALQRHGAASEDTLFSALDSPRLLQFLAAFDRQRRTKYGGLTGAEVYLPALARLYRDGLTASQSARVLQEAVTVATDAGSWWRAPVRIRALTQDDDEVSHDHVVLEEDSAFGYLYDNSVGWISACFLTPTASSFARQWGKQSVFQFATNSTAAAKTAGVQAYHAGKTDSKRLQRLLDMAWAGDAILEVPAAEEEVAATEL